MRKIIVALLLFNFFISFCQTTPFSEQITNPKGIVKFNDDLYIAASADGKIVKVDINATPLVDVVDVVSGLNRPFGLALNGNILYIVDTDNVSSSIPGKIYKVDVSISPTTLVEIYEFPLSREPRGAYVHDNKLYISEVNENKILVADILNDPNTITPSLFTNVPSAGPVGMVVDGISMYIAGRDDNGIFKVDDITSPPTNATKLIDMSTLGLGAGWQGPDFLDISDGYLYVSDRDASSSNSSDGNIARINLSNNSAEFLSSASLPEGILVFENNLYVSEVNSVNYFDLSLLSTDNYLENISNSALNFYPNPTKDFLIISGLKSRQSFKIYNLLGKLVKSGQIANGERINVSNLSSGMYLLKLNETSVYRIIKE